MNKFFLPPRFHQLEDPSPLDDGDGGDDGDGDDTLAGLGLQQQGCVRIV